MGEPTIQDVYNYWNTNPAGACSIEVVADRGTEEFFDQYEHIRENDIEVFSLPIWEFDNHAGEKVLDIGCGFGWLVKNYARGGADIKGIDIATSAVELTKKWLEIEGLSADLQAANAEELPFQDNTFDFISSSGVLHHTVDTQKAIDEVYRVLKPGCKSVISLYYKNFLLHPPFFQITLLLMRMLRMDVVAREKFVNAESVDSFVRQYDGTDNPIGRYYTKSAAERLFRKFKIIKTELHYFPTRFIPFKRFIPRFVHKLMDNYLGTLIYFVLLKE